ncbi:hypothetical protein EI94DRAFT_1334591 [Lactarius quietus]|nr:hypothetical protein EI94DRAFT_1334591 [Lactarius quietus]
MLHGAPTTAASTSMSQLEPGRWAFYNHTCANHDSLDNATDSTDARWCGGVMIGFPNAILRYRIRLHAAADYFFPSQARRPGVISVSNTTTFPDWQFVQFMHLPSSSRALTLGIASMTGVRRKGSVLYEVSRRYQKHDSAVQSLSLPLSDHSFLSLVKPFSQVSHLCIV